MNPAFKFLRDSVAQTGDWAGFLDRGTRVEGAIEVPGTFRLDGALEGRIVSGHALVLGETAAVKGEIDGDRVEIFGRFHGTLRARGQVQIHAGAEVTGDLYTPSLMIEPGAVFEGHCYLSQTATEPGVSTDPLMIPIRSTGSRSTGEPNADQPIEKSGNS